MIRRRLVSRKVDLAPIDWRFYLAIVVAIASTNLFYHFIVGMRELFRHLPAQEPDLFISLSPLKLYLYNFFFAFLSTTIGFMAFTKIWMSHHLSIPKLIRGRILFDQQYVPATFIYLFIKLAMLFGFIFSGNAIFMYIDFGEEFWPMMALAIVFLFMHQWLTLRLRVKQATIKVMGLTFVLQCFAAAVIAAVPIYDFTTIERRLIKKSPLAVMNLQLPKSENTGVRDRRDSFDNLHIGRLKTTNELVTSFGPFDSYFIRDDSVASRFIWAQIKMWYNWGTKTTNNPAVRIFSDKDVPAKKVIDIMKGLKKKGTIRYRLMVNDFYDGRGLPFSVNGHCDEVSDQLKLNYEVLLDEDTITFYSPVSCYSKKDMEEIDVFRLSFNDDQLLLNDSLISLTDLYNWASDRIVKNQAGKGKETILIPNVDDSTRYISFLRAYDATYTALKDARSKKLREISTVPYDEEFVNGWMYDIEDDQKELLKQFHDIYWSISTPDEATYWKNKLGLDIKSKSN